MAWDTVEFKQKKNSLSRFRWKHVPFFCVQWQNAAIYLNFLGFLKTLLTNYLIFPLPLWNFSEKYRKKTVNNVGVFSSNSASKKLSMSRCSWSKHDTGLSNLVFLSLSPDCSAHQPFMNMVYDSCVSYMS